MEKNTKDIKENLTVKEIYNKANNGGIRSMCRDLGIDPPVVNANEEQKFEWISNRIISLLVAVNQISEEGCEFGKSAAHKAEIELHKKNAMSEFLSSTRGLIVTVVCSSSAVLVGVYHLMLILGSFLEF